MALIVLEDLIHTQIVKIIYFKTYFCIPACEVVYKKKQKTKKQHKILRNF